MHYEKNEKGRDEIKFYYLYLVIIPAFISKKIIKLSSSVKRKDVRIKKCPNIRNERMFARFSRSAQLFLQRERRDGLASHPGDILIAHPLSFQSRSALSYNVTSVLYMAKEHGNGSM
ncbi:hypothetical protein PUN28_015714 [Cardiocondyla obscurior]|uniref:Uncharacterized protein n=1 Tax=Cardiocondyla obscurior TaxID=286306 RepID=A0AAW2EYQ3_9HYME